MLAVVGTIPDPDAGLVFGEAVFGQNSLVVDGRVLAVNRGTPALLGASAAVCKVLNAPPPYAYLAGDIGLGQGSRDIYKYLTENICVQKISVLVFHYLQPDVDWHNKVLFAIEEMAPRPFLIADAGFMYAAKMSGQATSYDLFTPDAGELAFLADEKAPHPFYTRGFILHEEDCAPNHINRAYTHENAAKTMLVKGKVDLVADRNGIFASIDKPNEEALEAIGGTGDTLTGIVSALVHWGMDVKEAAVKAAKINRLAGHYARPRPDTQVIEIIDHIPR
ncbi:MAG: NAD(P)H-hydrate dehydratase, partial [Desulfatibacillaceae bacterium]|nr:NAD(P)H-hydrate dehydratase [Desulfatibacillaceae bacterium]